jgi:anaerobic selenocysteine-containing dehydrogenase
VVAPYAGGEELAGPPGQAYQATGAGSSTGVPGDIDPVSTPGIGEVEQQGVPATDVVPGPSDIEAAGPEAAGEGEEPEPELPKPALLHFAGAAEQAALPQLDNYSLRLVVTRRLYDAGVLTQHSPSLANLARPARIAANHYDLDRLGLGNGGRVKLRGERGTLVGEAVVDDGVPRGSVALTFNLPGDAAADLVDATAPVNDVRLETP